MEYGFDNPDSARPAPEVLKAVVRANQNAGNLRRGDSHRSAGGRTEHDSPRGGPNNLGRPSIYLA
jgi:hypothetical protein